MAKRQKRALFALLLLLGGCVGGADGSFCDLCESPGKSGVSTCECYQFCCANGHVFDNPSICALMEQGARCDDPCAHCSDLHGQPDAQEACFQQCCRHDYFADSCRAWRFSAAEIYVSGSKLITDRRITPAILAGRADSRGPAPGATAPLIDNSDSHLSPAAATKRATAQEEDGALALLAAAVRGSGGVSTPQADVAGRSGQHMAAEKPSVLDQEEAIAEAPPCSYVDSECDVYCRGFDRPDEPIHTTCPTNGRRDMCGGWACSHTSKGRAQEGCFCCCSQLTDTALPDSSSDDDGDGDKSTAACEVGHDDSHCADYCAGVSPSYMPLTCSAEGPEHERYCGGHACLSSNSDAAQGACFCCCAEPTNEWQRVTGDALPGAEIRSDNPQPRAAGTAQVQREADVVESDATRGCPASAECADYCAGFGAFMDLHTTCAVGDDGDKSDHCGGWACENTSSRAAPDGCYCCCSSGDRSGDRNEGECAMAGNTCQEFCEEASPDFLAFSCPLDGADSSGTCGGHMCAATSEGPAQEGCFCCCSPSGVASNIPRGRLAGDSVPETQQAGVATVALAVADADKQRDIAAETQEALPQAPQQLDAEPHDNTNGKTPALSAETADEANGCGMTEDCKAFCGRFRDPLEPVHTTCPSVRGSTDGITCAGWGCSHASKAAGPRGCTCCCADYR